MRQTEARIPPAGSIPVLDVERVRRDFPILRRRVNGKPLVYLDSAATTQKPTPVLDAVQRFYVNRYSNVRRGVQRLSLEATQDYEAARERVRAFLNAREAREIVWVRGTTEAINLVANTFGRQRVGEGDEVLVTEMEHHSNIVPWQMLCEERGATLRVVPMDDRGELVLGRLDDLLGPRTRILAVAHVSNALGTVNPVAQIVAAAHARGVPVLVDGAQAVPRMPVDVQELGCDFYAFSGHKTYAPSGIGALYGRIEHLEALRPWQGGGDMIRMVTFEKTTYADVPYRFEAGTPNIAGAVGLSAALDYLDALGLHAVAEHERGLLDYADAVLDTIPGLRRIGTARERSGLVSFSMPGIHPHDLGTVLDQEGIAVRAGHHCAFPVMQHFGVPATVRASMGVYTTRSEIDALAEGVRKAAELFR